MYIGRQRSSAVGGFLNFPQLNGTPEVLRRDKSSDNIRGAREKQRSFLKRAKCTRKRVRGDGSGRCGCRNDQRVATTRDSPCIRSLNHIGSSGRGRGDGGGRKNRGWHDTPRDEKMIIRTTAAASEP